MKPQLETLEDRLVLSTLPPAPVPISLSNGVLTIQGTPQADHVRIDYGSMPGPLTPVGGLIDVQMDGVHHLYPNNGTIKAVDFESNGGNDVFINNTSLDTVANGGAGNSLLVGGYGHNVLRSHGGNDVLLSRGTNDQIFGGSGKDIIVNGAAITGGPSLTVAGTGTSIVFVGRNSPMPLLAASGQDIVVHSASDPNMKLALAAIAAGTAGPGSGWVYWQPTADTLHNIASHYAQLESGASTQYLWFTLTAELNSLVPNTPPGPAPMPPTRPPAPQPGPLPPIPLGGTASQALNNLAAQAQRLAALPELLPAPVHSAASLFGHPIR